MTYTSTTKVVDIETGQLIRWDKRNKQIYITIKITKHATTDFAQGRCHIEYTRQVKRNPQTRLEFS